MTTTDAFSMNLVAADVRRLTLFVREKLEPPYVGCYKDEDDWKIMT